MKLSARVCCDDSNCFHSSSSTAMRPHSPSTAPGSTMGISRCDLSTDGPRQSTPERVFYRRRPRVVTDVYCSNRSSRSIVSLRSKGSLWGAKHWSNNMQGANSTSRKSRGHNGEPPSLRWRKSLEDKGEKAIGDTYGQNIGLMKSPRLGGH